MRQQILDLLRNSPLTPRDLARALKFEPTKVAIEIDKLREEQKISVTAEGKLIIIK
jgi:predicted transcriptional regulator